MESGAGGVAVVGVLFTETAILDPLRYIWYNKRVYFRLIPLNLPLVLSPLCRRLQIRRLHDRWEPGWSHRAQKEDCNHSANYLRNAKPGIKPDS